jgi:hypothetical protein
VGLKYFINIRKGVFHSCFAPTSARRIDLPIYFAAVKFSQLQGPSNGPDDPLVAPLSSFAPKLLSPMLQVTFAHARLLFFARANDILSLLKTP